MALGPTHQENDHSFSANKEFTDREEPRALFTEALTTQYGNRDYNVLTFYGVGGQGKTALCHEFIKMIKINQVADDSTSFSWAKIDFETDENRNVEQALLQIRLKLKASGSIKFPAFDLAFSRYHRLRYPGRDIRAKYPELFKGESETIQDIVDISGDLLSEVPGFSFVYKYASRMTNRFNEWWERKGVSLLRGLDEYDEQTLLEKLGVYLGADIYEYLHGESSKGKSRKIVILLDTYEALWRDVNLTDGVSSMRRDKWVRQLVSECPGVVFIIFGRNKLDWEDNDSDWKGVVDQHILGGLSNIDADKFLKRVPIIEDDIRQIIINSAKGLPFYLDLQVNIYEREKRTNDHPVKEMFGGTDTEIIARFLDHLDNPTENALKILAQCRSFDERIFNFLSRKFPALALVRFEQITGHSFIDNHYDDGQYLMHSLMREYLVEQVKKNSPQLFSEVHEALFNFYDANCSIEKAIDIKAQHCFSFREAAYHLEIFQPLDFPKWAPKKGLIFFNAAAYDLIEPIYRTALSIAMNNREVEKSDIAICQSCLGNILGHKGQFSGALEYFELALANNLEIFGAAHPTVATDRIHLAAVLTSLDKHQRAFKLYEQALDSRLNSFGDTRPEVAEAYRHLGVSLDALGQHDKALELYKLALASDLNNFKEGHCRIAASRSLLGGALKSSGQLEKSVALYEQALASHLESFGKGHPTVVREQNNLAGALISLGQYQKATEISEHALASALKNLGESHPKVVSSYNTLSNGLYSLGQFDKALELLKRALACDIKTYGVAHSRVATIRSNMASVLEASGQYEKAIELYELALASNLETFEGGHPIVVYSFTRLAIALESLNMYEKAVEVYRQALLRGLDTDSNNGIDKTNFYESLNEHFNTLEIKERKIYFVLLGRLGFLLAKINQNKNSLVCSRLVVNIAKQLRRQKEYSTYTYLNIGLLNRLEEHEELDGLAENYQQYLAQYSDEPWVGNASASLLCLWASSFHKRGEVQDAKEKLEQAHSIIREKNLPKFTAFNDLFSEYGLELVE